MSTRLRGGGAWRNCCEVDLRMMLMLMLLLLRGRCAALSCQTNTP